MHHEQTVAFLPRIASLARSSSTEWIQPIDASEDMKCACSEERFCVIRFQTEGGMPMKPSAGGLQGLIEKAAPTLAATAGNQQTECASYGVILSGFFIFQQSIVPMMIVT
jgi:hypothetical protein